ncbi:hypothetical protein EAF04_001439 [Stromatinia cepivora]|nr:hypothetical protein EAF04_001439 [Stromatinia cepivora]
MTLPIKIYSHAQGPNSWKISIVCDELNIPYELEFKDNTTVKEPKYLAINPKGRVPAIEDPNTKITLWESGAIIKYLIKTYDKEGKLSISTFPEEQYLDQWLFFQASGQGPYFGQALWFSYFHLEKIPSAKDRYVNEIKRVTKVLDTTLTGTEYLVGKLTFADLAFVPWYWTVAALEGSTPGLLKGLKEDSPNFAAWLARLEERESVKKELEKRKELSAPPKK